MKALPLAATVLSAVLIGGRATAQVGPRPGNNAQPGFGPPPRAAAQRGFRQQGPQRAPDADGIPRGGFAQQRGPGGGGVQQRGSLGGQGQRQFRGPGSGAGPMLKPECLKDAGATDEQIDQLRRLRREQEIAGVDLKASAEKAQIALKQLMDDPDASEKDILKAVDVASEARSEIIKQGVSARFRARKILGEDVARKLRETAPGRRRGPGGPQAPRCPAADADA
jgi:hypothetical protein